MITKGSVAKFAYMLSDDDGRVIESNKGELPITYKHGERQIIPWIEIGLLGLEVNEEKRICAQPEDACGPVNPEGFKEVAGSEVPAVSLHVGAMLRALSAEGRQHFTAMNLQFDPRVCENLLLYHSLGWIS
jgi:FKBP-type peptidyl-prolyl cis-trans isomerase 2